MNTSPLRRAFVTLLFAIAAVPLRADRLDDLCRQHVESSGGAARLQALAAIRATGAMTVEGRRISFTLTAARPNRLRLETNEEGQQLIQGYDGESPPWEHDPAAPSGGHRVLGEPNATRLMSDAEYDGPLIAGSARGYRLEYVGEVQFKGGTYHKVLVAFRFLEGYALLLDPRTALIAYRVDSQSTRDGGVSDTITRYERYAAVEGVMLPHEITTTVEGRVTQQMRVERIEANPVTRPEHFAAPK